MKTLDEYTKEELQAVVKEIESIGVDNVTVDKAKRMSQNYQNLCKLDLFFYNERSDSQASDILHHLKKLV